MKTTPTTFTSLIDKAAIAGEFVLDHYNTRLQFTIANRHNRMFVDKLRTADGELIYIKHPEYGVFAKSFDFQTADSSVAYAPLMSITRTPETLKHVVAAIVVMANNVTMDMRKTVGTLAVCHTKFVCESSASSLAEVCFITVQHTPSGAFLYGTLEYPNGDVFVLSNGGVYKDFSADINNFKYAAAYAHGDTHFTDLTSAYQLMHGLLSIAEMRAPTSEPIVELPTEPTPEPKVWVEPPAEAFEEQADSPKVKQSTPPNYVPLPPTQTMLAWVIYHLVEHGMFLFSDGVDTQSGGEYQVNVYDIAVMIEALWRSEYDSMPFNCLVEHMRLMIGEAVRRALGDNINMRIITPPSAQQHYTPPMSPHGYTFGQRPH